MSQNGHVREDEREPLPPEARRQAITVLTALWNGEVDRVLFEQQGTQQKAYPLHVDKPTAAPRKG